MRVAIRAKLEDNANVVEPDFELNAVPDDPDDNRVLECAVAGKAECIVSRRQASAADRLLMTG